LLSSRRTIVCVADAARFTLQQLASDHQTRRQDGNKEKGEEILGKEVFPQVIEVKRQKGGEEGWSEEQPPEIFR